MILQCKALEALRNHIIEAISMAIIDQQELASARLQAKRLQHELEVRNRLFHFELFTSKNKI